MFVWFAESNVGIIVGVVVGVVVLLIIILLAVIFGRKRSRGRKLAIEHGRQSGTDSTRYNLFHAFINDLMAAMRQNSCWSNLLCV